MQLQQMAAQIITEDSNNQHTPHEQRHVEKHRTLSSTGIKKRFDPKEYLVNIVAADIGILPTQNQKKKRFLEGPATCEAGFIECEDGFAVINGEAGTTTCQSACEGKCCDTSSSCDKFTGKVCMDYSSCMGSRACSHAAINYVASYSCVGERSCFHAKFDSVMNSCQEQYACRWSQMRSNVLNSCQGYFSCQNIGTNSGSFGDMLDSCHGTQSCDQFAMWSDVGLIENSCLGDYSCYRAAKGNDGEPSYIGAISGSCQGDDACVSMASAGGSIQNITGSCNGHKACHGISADGSSVGNIVKACLGEKSCLNVGRGGANNILGIESSCNADLACTDVAYNDGGISTIDNACNAYNACHGAAQGSTISELIECCNTDNSCAGITSLPSSCAVRHTPTTLSDDLAPSNQTANDTTLSASPTELSGQAKAHSSCTSIKASAWTFFAPVLFVLFQ
eukprot:CAMPEP_0183759376 /NCGR_PEP_ID=MMETSP0739-20130205/7059_1 /TAXON_ID=385413 /ORGANISM="Thalassiosira miniscula, Strain CCMP1093" /LENGTH=449 /DNA_ID=CAMNT_0025997161 /DNA_START=131 /DNA_END=1480 /DNA_ORIENTATION=+